MYMDGKDSSHKRPCGQMEKTMTNAKTLRVIEEVTLERIRQDEKWGGPKHDDTHHINHFLGFINDKSEKARKAMIGNDAEEVKRRLVQVAALAVAGIERIERYEENARFPENKK